MPVSRAGSIARLVLVVALALSVSPLPAAAKEPNAAGIVVQFGDGSRVYAYVQFSEDAITSEQLLVKTGMDIEMAPYGGLGAGVCSIRGEGCPASNCWCQSFGNPSFYWHFYAMSDGKWMEQLQGPTSRRVRDGDIDGWLWSSGDGELPLVTIDDIAALAGATSASGQPRRSSAGVDAVFVPVDGIQEPLQTSDPSGSSYTWFAVMIAAGLFVIAIVVIRNRRTSPVEQAVTDA